VRLNQEDGQTIVLVTHDTTIGDRVPRLLTMRDGELVADVVRTRPARAGREAARTLETVS
jgi:putative ABC transport system ATP-binding protein